MEAGGTLWQRNQMSDGAESGDAMFFMEEVLHNQPYGPTTLIVESWTSIDKICTVANDLPIGVGPALIAKGGIKVLGVKMGDNFPAVKPLEDTPEGSVLPDNQPDPLLLGQ